MARTRTSLPPGGHPPPAPDWPDLLADAASAAPALVGCLLLRRTGRGELLRARILETEAYLPDDPASHSFAGPTTRNRSMFGRAGLAYVYRIHRSFCLNVVTGPPGRGEAVLLRAVEVIEGWETAVALRAAASVASRPPHPRSLANGPGKLCQALDVTTDLDGVDLLAGGSLTLERGEARATLEVSTRIGISKAADLPLRFFERGHPGVSRRGT